MREVREKEGGGEEKKRLKKWIKLRPLFSQDIWIHPLYCKHTIRSLNP